MTRNTTCPHPARLRALLGDRVSESEQAELVAHLDDCGSCQQALEAISGGPPRLRLPKDALAPTSAFWPALQQLQAVAAGRAETPPPVATLDEINLDFLGPPAEEGHLGSLSHFAVVGVVGRGGMGVVLKGLDACLQRFVALKVLDPALASNETARARFCREARSAAAVTHENVVAVHQVEEDEHSGLPFLVMQLVSGISLQDRLEQVGRPLELREIVSIGAQTAAGLAAAHAQGLIHRDIKPANILLENGVDRVKLTDFGLARAAEDVKLTATGLVAGTPLYMAPEQARGEPLDHRADLFSFGSVLYVMCTGKPPFDGSAPYLVLKSVTEELPRPVQEINPAIPDWLVDLIDQLHAKDPNERVQSAAEVAEVLNRHLAELVTTTQVPTVGAAARGRLTPRGTRRVARSWMDRVRLGLEAALVLLVATLLATELTGLTHVARRLTGAGEPVTPARATLNGNAGPVWAVAYAPDGETLAMAIDDGKVKLWDPAGDGRVRATLNAHTSPVWSVAFAKDGLLATASDDATVKIWDTAGQEVKTLSHVAAVRAVAFAPDGKTVASGSRTGAVRLWDVATGKETATLKGHDGGVIMAVAFAPDGKTVASAGGDKTVRLWDTASGRERVSMPGHTGAVYGMAFSPDGKTVASGGWDKSVRLWDAATGNQLNLLQGHDQDVWSVAFSPDGRLLASGSEDRTVKLWDVATGREVATFYGHGGSVYAVRFAPDGRTLASGSRDGTVRVWDVPGQ